MIFLIVSGVINAVLNLFLVIVFHLDVAGVGIATVISQLVSCILVLRCLHHTESSYQLHLAKLRIRSVYLKQIFEVGVPAGIQSTVINISNAMLQSSVNSFGSIAMAGYTASNNIFGFLYVSVNSFTQACMSFTSQNYGVKKLKRMDRVLIDCMILSVVVTLILGSSVYIFGPELLHIYSNQADVIKYGMEIFSYTTVTYFLCGLMDLFPGALRGMGYSTVPMILSIIGTVGVGSSGSTDCSFTQITDFLVSVLSGILDCNDHHAGDLLLVCKGKDPQDDGDCGRVIFSNISYISYNDKKLPESLVGMLPSRGQ